MTHEQEKIIRPYRNNHLSVSRLKLFEQCPLKFKFSYVDGIWDDMDKDAANMGSLVHHALELIYGVVLKHKLVGKVPDKGIIKCYRQAFQESPVVGDDSFQEGLMLTRAYLASRVLDHRKILGLEKKFVLKIGAFDVLGFIDRIDKVDDRTVKVVDYKTSRMLFSKDEVDSDLQMSVYGLAILKMFDWVEEIQYEFEMVRHNATLATSRTFDRLAEAAAYVAEMGKRIESAETMPAKLNGFCPWCDHRGMCHAYQDALKNGEGTLRFQIAAGDVQRLSEERERAALLERIAKRRKQEMDNLLKAHIKQADTDEGLVVNGYRYKMAQRWNCDYPREPTIAMLTEQLAVSREMIEKRLVKVNTETLGNLLKEVRVTSSQRQMINFKLERITDRSASRPYVTSSKVHARR